MRTSTRACCLVLVDEQELHEQNAQLVDIAVGENLRIMREIRTLSILELSMKSGIAVDKLKRFELGSARILPTYLWSLAKVLNTTISSFFVGIENDKEQESRGSNYMT